MATLLNTNAVKGHAIKNAYISAFSIDGWNGAPCYFGTFVAESDGEPLVEVHFDAAEIKAARKIVTENSVMFSRNIVNLKIHAGEGTVEIAVQKKLSIDDAMAVGHALEVLSGEMIIKEVKFERSSK